MLAVLILCFQVAAILLLLYNNALIRNERDDLIGINVKLIALINDVHNDLIVSAQETKDALEDKKHIDELYNNAIEAIRLYAGKTEDNNK